MKILVSSDWHLDSVTAGVERFNDLKAAVWELYHFAKAERVDLFMFLGDLCDPDTSRAYRAMAFSIEVALTFADDGIPSIWITGNHDVIEDGHGSSTLLPLHKAVACRNVTVVDRPMPVVQHMPINLIALPYTPRSHNYDPEAYVRGLETKRITTEPTVIAAHLNIEGIGPGSETTDLPRGRDVFLPVAAIRERWPDAIVLNGHYHKRQTFNGVHIPGSLERLTFGEEENEPGYLLVEV